MKIILPLLLSITLLGAGCVPQTAAPNRPGQEETQAQPAAQEKTAPPAETAPAPAAKAPAKTTTATGTVHLSIISYEYSPATLKVKRGTKIVVTNKDGVAHTVTSDRLSFDSGELNFNESVTIDTATLSPGTYTYHCVYHKNMKGTVLVE